LVVCLLRATRGPSLFPYTTLFRSAVREVQPADEIGVARHRRRALMNRTSGKVLERDESRPPWRPTNAERRSTATPFASSRNSVTDRKSTRLNSSHDQISYAVFCLK